MSVHVYLSQSLYDFMYMEWNGFPYEDDNNSSSHVMILQTCSSNLNFYDYYVYGFQVLANREYKKIFYSNKLILKNMCK